jgi:hypothetical protein
MNVAEALMQHGTQLPDALMRSNPVMANVGERDRAKYVEQTYVRSIAFAMAKSAFPIPNLLAAAGQSALYAPTSSREYVMIVPYGMMEIEKYTKETSMVYSVSGVPTPDGKPINLPLQNVFVHTPTNLKIMTHVPTASMRVNGSAYPQAAASGLASRVQIAMYYYIPTDAVHRITDFKNRTWHTVTGPKLIIRPRMEIMASSAILAVAGSETGELLTAYPSTGISTSQTTETMKMQLRVYMGAAVYKPDNVIILPDIMPNGVVSGGGVELNNDIFETEDMAADELRNAYVAGKPIDVATVENDMRTRLNDIIEGAMPQYYPNNQQLDSTTYNNRLPLIIYPGRVDKQTTDGWITIQENTGHLGCLDDPEADRLHGLYKYNPDVRVRKSA